MCLKIYIKVYLMHKTNHAKLVNRWRMDRNKNRLDVETKFKMAAIANFLD